MKNILLTLFLGITTAACFAQDGCKLCGDWVGVYEKELGKYDYNEDRIIPASYKLYVRIKKIDDTYIVRVKERIIDGSTDFNYMPDCIITNSSDNRISWYWDWGDDDNGGYGYSNGVAYTHQTSYVTIYLESGKLIYTGITIIKEYNRRGELVKQWESPHGVFPCGDAVTLYKDDSDW